MKKGYVELLGKLNLSGAQLLQYEFELTVFYEFNTITEATPGMFNENEPGK